MAREKRVVIGDLAGDLASDKSTTKAAAEEAVKNTIRAIRARLGAGEAIYLDGLGTFSVKQVPDRMVRNPSTGEKIAVAAHKKLAFKASKGVV